MIRHGLEFKDETSYLKWCIDGYLKGIDYWRKKRFDFSDNPNHVMQIDLQIGVLQKSVAECESQLSDLVHNANIL